MARPRSEEPESRPALPSEQICKCDHEESQAESQWSLSSNTVGRVPALHTANLGSIHGTPI